jgi:hypothetical protein
MKLYEYMVTDIKIGEAEYRLNLYAKEGWRVIDVKEWSNAHFKYHLERELVSWK